jgi:hypothetical protein
MVSVNGYGWSSDLSQDDTEVEDSYFFITVRVMYAKDAIVETVARLVDSRNSR